MKQYFITMLMVIPFMSAFAQHTETMSLNGIWDFYCSAGMNSGKWSKIRVPSQWEQQGFGAYTYGRYYIWDKDAKPSDETGTYKRSVMIPKSWQGKNVSIVFEGVMTDTELSVNGQSTGEIHQGGFYVFDYDITKLIKYGTDNMIEVKVAKQSANKTVNDAERRADWWLFGGIYRPVYLKAVPQSHIDRLQVDARADGTLRTRVHVRNADGCSVRLQLSGSGQIEESSNLSDIITTKWNNIKTWDPEHPNLYTLTVTLLNKQKQAVHEMKERIGFRTVEFREGDGFYVNGTRIMLKGINRHCFTPEEGRTPSHKQNVADARLIKSMNMNAVRSHYSPDRDFLNVCDSVGLFYLDEFCGWHGHYDQKTGLNLLKEQMASDQNHPCIFLWSNGNEGGWNKNLDGEFSKLDIQQRHVVHPWQDFNGVDTHHYPAYYTGPGKLSNGYKVFMPTEFLHSQYDRGGGAGLEDYWDLYKNNPLSAGGFIWSFADEAVARTDQSGLLDTDGPNAPDGIVGPHREKEGSYYTIRDVWSPIQISPLRITPSFNGDIFVRNEFLFSNLRECRMTCTMLNQQKVLSTQQVSLPAIDPGETAKAHISLPSSWQQADILRLDAIAQNGDTINSWTWPIHTPAYYLDKASEPVSSSKAVINGNSLAAANVTVTFTDGLIKDVKNGNEVIPFTNGPLPVGMKAAFVSASTRMEGADAIYCAKYQGSIDSIQWRMHPDGTLLMEAVMLNKTKPEETTVSKLGLTFSYPEKDVKGMTWMGRGPYRVWKNRLRGQLFGFWHKAYNNTVTGEQYENLKYPEFKGYHANLYWATLEMPKGSFTVNTATEGIYFRIFTPQEPEHRRDGMHTLPSFPNGNISFMYEIPAIAAFRTIEEQGPHSQPLKIRLNNGDEGLHLKLLFNFKK